MNASGGINTVDCRFGGVSSFAREVETSLDCSKANGLSAEERQGLGLVDEYMFPNTYSTTNQMLLILYSYKEYITLTAHVQITATLCVVQRLEPCQPSSLIGMHG